MAPRLRGRARAAGALATIALAIGGFAGTRGSASSVETTKPPAPTLAEDLPDATAAPPPTVPATSELAGCSDGWTSFDNPALHYRMCVPPGWGFTDFTAPGAMERVPVTQLTSLHLVSARAFPWRPGDLPFDAIRARGMIDVELDLLEPGMRARDECEPAAPLLVGGIGARSCVQFYDSLGLPASAGALQATKVVVPLIQAPALRLGGDLSGASLLVIARTSTATPEEEVTTLWRLIDSIQTY